jgi:two-component sensor histidine kinase
MGSQTFEMQILHSDGFIAWYSINAGPIFFDKEVVGVTVITRNISERKQGEEKVKQSLKEKEILLQEVHHRVKNNLQIILSIINLQFGTVKDKKTLDLLRDVRNRIKAMSFVHELLYQANDFSSINFSEYVSNIINNLIYSYAQKQSVVLKQDIDPVFLDLDIAIPCGLIINELITNSLKYAFSENENGELFISLKQTDGTIKMVIADTGKGFPNTINFRKTKSLGMQLVVALLDQIGGTIELDNTNGTAFSIAFKNK